MGASLAVAALAASSPLQPFYFHSCSRYLDALDHGCDWADSDGGCSSHVPHGPPEEKDLCCCPVEAEDIEAQRALCAECEDDADQPHCSFACSSAGGQRGRQAQCSASAAWLKEHRAEQSGRAILGQEEARDSPRLNYEQNATADVEDALRDGSLLALLPAAAGLADNFSGEWGSCAVVGSSSSLLGHGEGAAIDAHDQVIRINSPPTAGFEEDVGKRTSLDMFWGDRSLVREFDRLQLSRPAEERAVGLVAASTRRDISNFFDALRAGREGKPSLRMVSGYSRHAALDRLCGACDGGAVWHNRIARIRPSTGFFAVAFALANCRNVSIFGFGDPPACAAHHYYDAPPSDASKCNASAAAGGGQKESEKQLLEAGVAPNHWFDLEHSIYGELQRQERLRMHARTNFRDVVPAMAPPAAFSRTSAMNRRRMSS